MKDFELSLWRTIPRTATLTNNETISYLGEEKVYILASSNSLENPYRAYDIHFIRKINSEKTITFKVLKECFDPQTGKVEDNYFVDLLVNKALIKLKYKDRWYDFLIQEREETRDQKGVGYKFTCEDLSICELSKNGYSLEFDEETGVGDIDALGAEIVKGTTYNYQNSAAGSFTEYKEGYEYDITSKTYKEQRTPVAIAKMDKSAYYGKYLQKAKDIWCAPDSEGGELIDQTPYNFQKITYDNEVVTDKIIGGTIGWNQLVKNGNFEDTTGWSLNNSSQGSFTVQNNICTITLATKNASTYIVSQQRTNPEWTPIIGHIYMCSIEIKPNKNSKARFMYGNIADGIDETSITGGVWNHYNSIIKLKSTPPYSSLYFYFNVGAPMGAGDVVQVKNAYVTDLTLAFGPTIAEYVYNMTHPEGVEWLKSHGFFTKPYYAYNTGKLMSVNTSAHIIRGFNQFNIATKTDNKILIWASGGLTAENLSVVSDYIRVVEGQEYYCNYKAQWMCYNFNKEYLGSLSANGSFVPAGNNGGYPTEAVAIPTRHNIYYIRLGFRSNQNNNIDFTSKSDMMFNISQPNTTISPHNGEYVPYSENIYSLDSSLTLNGLYKLDTNNELYCDGDTYESNGTVTRKYESVDLGSLTWKYNSSSQFFYTTISQKKPNISNLICGRYATTNAASLTEMPDKSIRGGGTTGDVIIKDSNYTDAAVFKTAMSGVYLVYELATPTTETADPFTNPQRSILGGTSQYIDYACSQGNRDVEIPVGHQTSTIIPISVYLVPENIKVEPIVVKNMVSNSKDFTTLSGWESEVGNQLELYSEYRNNNELQGLNYFLKLKGGDQWYYNNTMINGKTDFRTGKMYVFRYTASSQIFSQFSIYDGYHFIDGTGSTNEPIFTSGNTALTQNTYFMFTPAQYIKYPQLALKTTNSDNQLLESIEIFEVACKNTSDMDSFQNLILANGIVALSSSQVEKLILPGDTSSVSAAGLYTTYKYQWFEDIGDEEGEPRTISFAQYHSCNPSDITPFEYGAEGAEGTFSTLYGYCEGTYYTKVSGEIVEVDDVDRSTEYKKRRTLIASKSNRYQLLQDISELFNGWVKIDIQHKTDGEIDYELNTSTGISYKKYVSFVEVVGKENDVGFKYGVNLKSINRKINSKEITTKTIVESNENSAVDRGIISIAQAPSNPTKENFIYNFRYFVNAGIIDGDILNTRLYGTNGLEAAIGRINNEIFSLNEKLMSAENKLEELKTQRDTYETMRGTAKKSIDSLAEDIMKSDLDILAGKGGLSPMAIRDKRIVMAGQAQRISELNQAIATEDESNWFQTNEEGTANNISTSTDTSANEYRFYPTSLIWEGGFVTTMSQEDFDKNYSFWNLNDRVRVEILKPSGTPNEVLIDSRFNFDTFVIPPQTSSTIKVKFTIFQAKSLGTINYTELDSYNVIDNTGGYGYLEQIVNNPEHPEGIVNRVNITNVSAYVDNLINTFVLSQSLYCPGQWQPRQEGDYLSAIQELETEVSSYQTQIENLQAEKEALISAFENEYSRYLSEGTWTDNNYVDNDEFYFDALQVAHTSSMPTADYTINVVDITNILDYVGEFPHQEDYEFSLGDKTFVTDEELYGKDDNGVLIRQEVIISELESVLDNPAKSTLKVQNYRTQFEDLFQRVAAATTSLTLKEQIYDKADLFTATGEIDKTVLQKTLSENNFLFTNADQVNYTIDSTGIQLVSMENPSKMLKIISEGILITQDGGITWETGISANGLNANHLNAGSIDTSQVRIYSENAMTFSWDELGITAYGRKLVTGSTDAYTSDPKNFVRLDRYGLYIIENNSNFNLFPNGNTWDASLTEESAIAQIKSNARVSITKEGFSYKSGSDREGTIEIGDANQNYAIFVANADNEPQFTVNWDGEVYINQSLQIGQWKIDNKGLYYGNDASTSTIFLRPQPLTTTATTGIIFQAGNNFSVTKGGILTATGASFNAVTMHGNITWDADASPHKVVYAAPYLTAPSVPYASIPDSSADGWHRILTQGDKYQAETGDNGATWTGPFLIQGESAYAAYITTSRSPTFYNTAGTIQMNAHIYEGDTEITSSIGSSGTKYASWHIHWYKNNSSISTATATASITVTCSTNQTDTYIFKIES